MTSSRIARAVGVASLGLLAYASDIGTTQAGGSHCGVGTVNAAGTCDCPKCFVSVGPSGAAHCAPAQKQPGCGPVNNVQGGGSQVNGVVPIDVDKQVQIKGGTFVAGSNDAKDYDSSPTHPVTLGDFKIDKYEVTVSEYEKCVKLGKCATPPVDLESMVPNGARCNWGSKRKAHPMNCVTWTEASAFCSAKGGRLPTEAEWEFAAKGGKTNVYPWGNTPDPSCKYANYTATAAKPTGGCGDGTAPVGTHPLGQSTFGVMDMAGNVEEWVLDWWGNFSGMPPNNNNPVNADAITARRTIKGGSWDLTSNGDMHTVRRESMDPGGRQNWLGFRCATGPTPMPSPEMFKKQEPAYVPPPPPPPPPPPAPNVPAPGDLGTMIKIPGGTYQMGDSADALSSPPHMVTLASYSMDKYEVTVSQFRECVDKKGCAPPLLLSSANCNYSVPGRDNHPVNCVEWSDAKRYCGWLGKRMPTEAEWEFAARGPSGRTYPWGNTDPTCTTAAFSPRDKQKCASSTQVVGTHPLGVSYFGVFDMAGNAEEWVFDFYSDYQAGPQSNPSGPATGEEHVIRGGNWTYEQAGMHTYGRWHSKWAVDWIGFRCAKTN